MWVLTVMRSFPFHRPPRRTTMTIQPGWRMMQHPPPRKKTGRRTTRGAQFLFSLFPGVTPARQTLHAGIWKTPCLPISITIVGEVASAPLLSWAQDKRKWQSAISWIKANQINKSRNRHAATTCVHTWRALEARILHYQGCRVNRQTMFYPVAADTIPVQTGPDRHGQQWWSSVLPSCRSKQEVQPCWGAQGVLIMLHPRSWSRVYTRSGKDNRGSIEKAAGGRLASGVSGVCKRIRAIYPRPRVLVGSWRDKGLCSSGGDWTGHPCLILRATSLSLQGDPANIGKGHKNKRRMGV